jgi:hypothetical protein
LVDLIKSVFGSSEEFGFFVVSLESTVSHFTGSIDEFKVDLFQSSSTDLGNQTLSENENFFLGSNDATFDHEEIFSDDSVMGESSDGGDILFSEVGIGGGIVGGSRTNSLSDSVNFLVHFGTVVISQLTSSRNSPSYTGRMPRSHTTNFTITSVGLFLQVLHAPTFYHSLESFSFCHSQNVNHFVLLEH